MKAAAELAAGDETPDTPPTHTLYMPVWEPGGRKFKTWLPIGSLWRDDRNTTF